MDPEQHPDQTQHLADVLRLPLDDFLELFGAGWYVSQAPPAHDFDADPDGGLLDGAAYDVTPWHLAGEPVQLMARVFGHGVFLARPEGVWAGGTHGLEHRPVGQVYVGAHELHRVPAIVSDLLSRRRRSFRYCRLCREVRAPENMWEPQVCHDCATAWFGVVY